MIADDLIPHTTEALELSSVDQEEDEAEDIQYVQRVVTRFQGIDVDTWLKIIMLVRTIPAVDRVTN